ncbi:DUF4157 domain-containing protein [Chloroflexota bacterium]
MDRKDIIRKFKGIRSSKPAKTPNLTQHQPVNATQIQRAVEDPSTMTPEVAQMLQSTHGNHFVNKLVGNRQPIQAKLTVTPAGDKYEQEADQVASQVVGQMNSGEVQRDGEEEMQLSRIQRDEEDELMMSRIQRDEEDELMMSRIQRDPEEEELMMSRIQRGSLDDDYMGNTDVSSGVESQINNARGGGQSIPDTVRGPMEQAFGADFGGVRVHSNAQSDGLNREVQANAFTTGSDIFFKQGAYSPGSQGGKELLAHELTHTIQQGAVGQGKVERKKEDD